MIRSLPSHFLIIFTHILITSLELIGKKLLIDVYIWYLHQNHVKFLRILYYNIVSRTAQKICTVINAAVLKGDYFL